MTGDELCVCGHPKAHAGEDFECDCGCEYFCEVEPVVILKLLPGALESSHGTG